MRLLLLPVFSVWAGKKSHASKYHSEYTEDQLLDIHHPASSVIDHEEGSGEIDVPVVDSFKLCLDGKLGDRKLEMKPKKALVVVAFDGLRAELANRDTTPFIASWIGGVRSSKNRKLDVARSSSSLREGVPIWIANARAGGTSALLHWPGADTNNVSGVYYESHDPSRDSDEIKEDFEKVIESLECGANLVMLYIPEPSKSLVKSKKPKVSKALEELDRAFFRFVRILSRRGLLASTDVLLTGAVSPNDKKNSKSFLAAVGPSFGTGATKSADLNTLISSSLGLSQGLPSIGIAGASPPSAQMPAKNALKTPAHDASSEESEEEKKTH